MRFLCLLLLCAALTGTSSKATAATIDVGQTGVSDCTFWCTVRLQQVYASSLFSGPVLVDSVSFFASTGNGGNAWNGTSTWEMTLSTSQNSVGSLSSTFASNVGGDAALFDTKTFTGTQNDNDLVTFDGAGSFYYDPGNGDLLIDIVRVAGPAFGVGNDAGFGNGGLLDRAYSFNSTVSADSANQDYGLRTRLGLLPVPEPGTALLVALGLLALRLRRSP